jgi:predicted nucleic acid-binding protein
MVNERMGGNVMVNVFVDTQVFVHKNFNFNNELFQKLLDCSNDGLISLYLTDVVKSEIESKIHEQVYDKIKTGHSKFIKEVKILKNLNEYRNIFEIDEKLQSIYKDLIKQFNQFLHDGDFEIISINDVSPSDIFAMYFDGVPPFSVKKKDEFPDAFSLVALEKKFNRNEKICVVSGDSDLKDYCEKSDTLVYEPSLEALFDSLTKNDSYRHQFVISVYDENFQSIASRIDEELEEQDFILIGEEGDVHNIHAKVVEIDEDPYVIYLNDEDSEGATLVFKAHISINAHISYADYSNSFYDKEEGKYLFVDTVETDIFEVVTVPILMQIKYKNYEKEELEIVDITINEENPIEIEFTNNLD